MIFYPLIVLLLADLFDVVEQLAHAQLQLGQLFLASYLTIVDGILADFDVQVNTQCTATAKPCGRVRVQADDVLACHVSGERETTFCAVQLKFAMDINY